MNGRTIKYYLTQFESDPKIMEILTIVKSISLKDSWVAAGLTRNYIWNLCTGKSGFDGQTDVDVVFFDPEMSDETTAVIEKQLKCNFPQYNWQLRNQADMHRHSPHTLPYTSARDAIFRYPETCTAVALRLDEKDELDFYCPYGLESITSFEIHPTPHFLADSERMRVYNERLSKKDWFEKWPDLQMYQK